MSGMERDLPKQNEPEKGTAPLSKRLALKRKKAIRVDDPTCRLGLEILKAEQQIRQGKTVPWSEIKRRHRLL